MIQTRTILNVACVGASLFALSGCELLEAAYPGSTTGDDGSYLDSAQFFDAATRAKSAFQSEFAAGPSASLPDSGNATFTGFGRVDLPTDPNGSTGTQLFGQAQLTADFLNGGANVQGSVSNFFVSGDNADLTSLETALESGDPDQVSSVVAGFSQASSGSLTIDAPSAPGPLFSADIDGSIDTGSGLFEFAGTTNGEFFGDPASILRITGDAGSGMTVTEGSTPRNASLVIIGSQ